MPIIRALHPSSAAARVKRMRSGRKPTALRDRCMFHDRLAHCRMMVSSCDPQVTAGRRDQADVDSPSVRFRSPGANVVPLGQVLVPPAWQKRQRVGRARHAAPGDIHPKSTCTWPAGGQPCAEQTVAVSELAEVEISYSRPDAALLQRGARSTMNSQRFMNTPSAELPSPWCPEASPGRHGTATGHPPDQSRHRPTTNATIRSVSARSACICSP